MICHRAELRPLHSLVTDTMDASLFPLVISPAAMAVMDMLKS